MKLFAAMLKNKGACEEGLEFALSHETAKEAWEACENPSYMLWALNEFDLCNEKKNRLFMAWCARHTPIGDGKTNWNLLTDERSRNAVIAAERFANGDGITAEELFAAWSAARSAAWSAARSAAESAAESAARSAARPAARPAAWSAAWSAARSAQAKALREIYGFPFTNLLASKKKRQAK